MTHDQDSRNAQKQDYTSTVNICNFQTIGHYWSCCDPRPGPTETPILRFGNKILYNQEVAQPELEIVSNSKSKRSLITCNFRISSICSFVSKMSQMFSPRTPPSTVSSTTKTPLEYQIWVIKPPVQIVYFNFIHDFRKFQIASSQ
jgi:hypothetical protein